MLKQEIERVQKKTKKELYLIIYTSKILLVWFWLGIFGASMIEGSHIFAVIAVIFAIMDTRSTYAYYRTYRSTK